MSFQEKNIDDDSQLSQVNEPDAGYEKAELDLIRNALKLSHTERFEMMMRLIKTGIMLKNARITHQQDHLSK